MKKQKTRHTPKSRFEKKFLPLREVQRWLVEDSSNFDVMMRRLGEAVAAHVAAQFPSLKTKTEEELAEEFEHGLVHTLVDATHALTEAIKADLETWVLR